MMPEQSRSTGFSSVPTLVLPDYGIFRLNHPAAAGRRHVENGILTDGPFCRYTILQFNIEAQPVPRAQPLLRMPGVKEKQVQGLCDLVTVCGFAASRAKCAVTEKSGRRCRRKTASQETCRLPVRERLIRVPSIGFTDQRLPKITRT